MLKKIKRLASIALALCVALSLTVFVPAAQASGVQTEGDFEFTVFNRRATITRYTGNAATLVVPGTLGGVPVMGIGDNVFTGNTSLVDITIPDGVDGFDEAPFVGCTSLTTIRFGRGFRFFSYSSNEGWMLAALSTPLTNIWVHPDNPHFSSRNGVLFNKAGTTLIFYPWGRRDRIYRIPNGVTRIGDGAFADNTRLTGVSIPRSVTTIGREAFFHTPLASVVIPNSVTTIGRNAFANTSLINANSSNSAAGRHAVQNNIRFRLINTPRPSVSTQGRRRRTVNRGANVTLRVSISRPNNQGRTSLRWQRRTGSNGRWRNIRGAAARGNQFRPQTRRADTTYYRLRVTNTDTGAVGRRTATRNSRVFRVRVR